MTERKTKAAIKKVLEKAGLTKEAVFDSVFNLQPMFYDRAKIWWMWNFKNCKYEIVDEVDIENAVDDLVRNGKLLPLMAMMIMQNIKNEARRRIPKKMDKDWIQFKNVIVDLKKGNEFAASPDYFCTNPIPWKLGKAVNTDKIDELFEQWVGADNVKLLKQILSYCLYPDYVIHRYFILFGSGLNGKGCYLNLTEKFTGSENICSTELDILLNSRFEVTRLHKKLVCVMGETNMETMSKTSLIKKLTGGDTIGFEYKNKTPFEDKNYAKIIIATNNLPPTDDKTIGFYRRPVIIDFPNQFTDKKDVLATIPDEEFENLARQCLELLKELLVKREFHNEGSIEEKTKRYEDRSNPFDKFWQDHIDADNPDGFITLRQFRIQFDSWCKENRFRTLSDPTLNDMMKQKGVTKGSTRIEIEEFEDGTLKNKRIKAKIWEGIQWKK